MIIAVIGNYDPPPHVYALAEGIGEELARRGITLVCGGLTGVMEAVCKGVELPTPVTFAESGEPSLLGLVSLEEVALAVDPLAGPLALTNLLRY